MTKQFIFKIIHLNKQIFFAAIFLIAIVNYRVNIFANEPEATDLTKSTTISISSSEDSSFLKDQSYATKKTLSGGTTITLTNDSGIKGFYIIWEQPPGEWQLDVNGVPLTYGKYGFIHEYIALDDTVKNAVIHIPATGAIIADVSTFSIGTVQSWVQVWKPPYEEADMVVIPTHADDEFLFFGGTMPYYAGELGLKVQVVYLTNHWAEYYRPHELLNGLWEVGITAYPIIGPFTDYYSTSLEHAMTLYPINDVIGFQVQMIRRFKPKVIIAQDFNGEYGHGVHMLNTYTLSKALEISNDANSYPDSAAQYGTWDVPKTYVHLYAKNQITMNWDVPLDGFGGTSAFDMAIRGFAKHKSQQTYYKVGREGVFNCMLFGLYRSTVGEDVKKNDFFENIDVFRTYSYSRKSSLIPLNEQTENSYENNAGVAHKLTLNSVK